MCGRGPQTPPAPPSSTAVVFVADYFPLIFSRLVYLVRSDNMGKKEEEDIIRIAKKMDKMAQKKNGVRCARRMNAQRYLRAVQR